MVTSDPTLRGAVGLTNSLVVETPRIASAARHAAAASLLVADGFECRMGRKSAIDTRLGAM